MLTKKQHDLLLFINERLQSSGISPSFDEMKDALGLKSKSGIHRLINALEERGFIRRMANRARALEVVKLPDTGGALEQPVTAEPAQNVIKGNFGSSPTAVSPEPADENISVPLHGRIAAGTPIEALENADSHLAIPPSMVGFGATYALEVSGESMIEMGIMDGDTVLVESCQTARDGDVVVALVDGEEATLKKFKRQGQHILLIPANRALETQVYEAERVEVQGKLIGLMRQYH